MKKLLEITANGATTAEEIYTQLSNQTNLCTGEEAYSPEDIPALIKESWITLENEKIIVWYDGV